MTRAERERLRRLISQKRRERVDTADRKRWAKAKAAHMKWRPM